MLDLFSMLKKAPHYEELNLYYICFFKISFCFGVKISFLITKYNNVSALANAIACLSVILISQASPNLLTFDNFSACLSVILVSQSR